MRGGWVDALPGTNAAVGIGRDATDGGEVLHPRKRFYAGGAQSVRGFGENQLGPRVLTVSPDDIRGRRDTTIAGQKSDVYACPEPTALATCFAQRRDQIDDDRFIPRPLGGTTLVEGNVELRVPIFGQLWGAVFLDGAMLGERTLRDLASGTSAVTPGFGVRYLSPVGPVRVDVGIRPSLVERLPVVTQVEDSTGRRLLDLGADRSCRTRSPADGCRNYPADRRDRREGHPEPHHAPPLDRRGVLMATDPERSPAERETSDATRPAPAAHHTGARIARWIAAILLLLVVGVVATVFVLTNTDWGREQLRRRVVAALAGTVHGRFQVGRISGNLLKGITLHDVAIADSQPAPRSCASTPRRRATGSRRSSRRRSSSRG